MKKQLLFVVSIVLTATFYAQNIPSYVPTNGLVGYWPFDGNSEDIVGNRDGILNNGNITSNRFGELNNAIKFNGTNSNIQLIDPGFNPGQYEYTINLWYRIDDLSKQHQTFLNSNPHNLIGIGYNGFHSGANTFLLIGNGNLWLNEGNWTIPQGLNYQNGNWTNLTLTKKGNIHRLYINGVLKNENSYGDIPKSTIELKLGSTSFNGEFLDGALDDLSIYNRALTQQEITALYTGTPVSQNLPNYLPSNGLVGWWPFNGNANDESGNGNHGNLLGNYSFIQSDGFKNNCIKFIGDTNVTPTNQYGEPLYLNGGHMKFPNLNNLISNSITVNLWIKCLDEIPKEYPLFFGMDNSGQNRLVLDYFNGFSIGDDNPLARIQHPFKNNLNEWKMLTLCYSPGNLKAYINSNLVGVDKQSIKSIPLINGALNWHIWKNNHVARGKAIYDDIAIYNRDLTQEEITALYLGDCTKPQAAITPKSTTNIKENESVVLAATKGNGYTYTWYKDGVAIANATDSNYTATLPGVYTVKVTSASCDSTSIGVTVKRVYALPNYLPTNGLVGWWPFNGNANDESGNENNGTVNGATLTSDRNGKNNSCYFFDKNQIQNIKVNSSTSLNNSSQYTANLWVNLRSHTGYNRYVNKGTGATGYQYVFANQDRGIYFYYNNNYYQTSIFPSLNTWHMVSVTYNYGNNNDRCIFYLDGNPIDTFQTTAPIMSNNEPLYFGSEFNEINTTPDGQLDDIAIYNRALTQEEITALYLGEACTTPIATITPQSATSFCSGGSVNLNAATNANYTYQWLNNGAPISAATTATYKATTSGKYSVIVKNNSGCIDTSSVISVNVTSTPSLPILTGPATLCYNSKAIFKASIAGGTWGVANDYLLISSPQGLFRNNKMPPSNLYKTGVTYTLKSKDKLCSITAQKSVWIRNLTATSITLTTAKQTLKVGEEVAVTATTKITGNLLYWLSASTSVVGVTGTSSPYIAIVKGLRPATGANITFSVDDAAKGCRNTAFLPFTVTAAASLVDNESNTTTYTTDLNVYPNPSNGMVTIENIGEAKTISLIDVTGRVLKTTTVNADRMRLDYSTITKGNYFISIQGENVKEMKSIVIE